MTLSDLSRRRSPLMGIAILWIMFYHGSLGIPDVFPFRTLHFLCCTGYGGVDIFFLLSGMGLAYSRVRHPLSLAAFWKRRFFRLIPVFEIASLLWVLFCPLRGESWPGSEKLFEIFSGLGFWMSGLGPRAPFWFVTVIATCYLFFPPLARHCWNGTHLSRRRWLLWFGAFTALAVLSVIFHVPIWYLIAIVRLPLFILGAGIGFLLNEPDFRRINPPFPLWSAAFALIAAAGSWYLFHTPDGWRILRHGFYWIPFWFITLPLCLGLCGILDFLERHGMAVLLLPLQWAGKRSLELYLMHITLFLRVPQHFLAGHRGLPRFLVLGFLALAGAELLGQLQDRLSRKKAEISPPPPLPC